MCRLVSWMALAISISKLSFAALPSNLQGGTDFSLVPNRFIIEIDTAANIPSKRSFERRHDAIYSALRERGIKLKVDREFDSADLFTGAAVTLKSSDDVAVVLNTPGIKAIRPVVLIPRPIPASVKAVTDKSDPAVPKTPQSTHIMTGVDKLHAEGLTGKGVKIGIIDTGIDYTHPALGGAFGPGNKVAGGYDIVGDAYDGFNTPVPDSDPLDQCNGHGTFVAGIIGANPGNAFDIVGVAPGATLSSYRIFGCAGGASDDVIVEALLRGYKDGQDILSLSLGSPFGWTTSTIAVLASRIARTGKVVTLSVGNAGEAGSWYSGAPADAIDGISVASVENSVLLVQKLIVGGVANDPGVLYYSTLPLNIPGTLPIYPLSNDTTIANDACSALPASTPNLSGFVVIVRRGTCSFVTKLQNIQAKGANYALIYDNGSGFSPIDVGTWAGKASLIRESDGVFLVEQWKAGAPVTVTFPQVGGSTGLPAPDGGLLSPFSSWGPTNDFYFKPSLAAPGGNILSIVPKGGFSVQSGTSFSTPFVAGAAALLLEAKGKRPDVGRSARTLFQSSAKYVPSSYTDGGPLQSAIGQGAGLINVYDAVHATTILSKTELVLNDTANFKPVQTFQVTNAGKKAKQYSLFNIPAGTALTFLPNTPFIAPGPVPLSPTGATASISPQSFSLRPGQSREVTVQFTPPKGLDATTFPVFSGFIQVSTPSEVSVHASYIGSVGSLKSVKILDTSTRVLPYKMPSILDSKGLVQEVATNYTFSPNDYPTLLARQLFATPLIRMDLVDPNIKIDTNVKRALHGPHHGGHHPWFSFPFHAGKGGGSFSKVKIVGALLEAEYLSRNDEILGPTGQPYRTVDFTKAIFANGTTIPNGQYRILLRALKVTGDKRKQKDYETWLSPIIGVQVPAN
ncbi:pyrolysin [Ephemerocybe angulata]|uniref:Pyrolysin n=1 Tax=Ephemerocybe angulata TaxID=980116 RepID=A0A8H6IFQ1_9AGAR|nr:pyrolysin [Tulosesus angulatus]